MYHPGRIVKILGPKDKNIVSCDATVQAVVEMWDDNLFTFLVDSKIAGKVKEDDVVLVDYTPMPNSPLPKHLIVKVLRGESANTIWKKYKGYHQRQLAMKEPMHSDDYMG
jgi:hypothetical protein